MTKTNTDKAAAIIKLLKKGMTPKEIRDRIGVSYNYAWKLQKDLGKVVEDTLGIPCTNDCGPKPEPEVSKVGKVLDEREAQYGSYMQASDTAVRIKGIMHNAVARNEAHLYPDQLQALDMIATKISRIVNGNPNHTDSWIDIAGYATLVADRLQGKAR
jgi:hypothetical protein